MALKNRSILRTVMAIILVTLLGLTNCSTPSAPAVKVDANLTGEPVSEYIYGQFIEHLGKCIYGGLWAEMLEDRKFYYPIVYEFSPWGTASDPFWNTGDFTYLDGSPWEMMGGPKSVTMDSKNAYTGSYSVRVSLSGEDSVAGILQARLGVVAGKKYEGRIILSGSEKALPITVRLTSGDGKSVMQSIDRISEDYQAYPIELTPDFSSHQATLEIFTTSKGFFQIGTVSLMPSDHISGWRADVVALLKELDSPVYRWPGGNFVSGYNWMDGIGERDKRAPRKNPAWKGVEANDVGIHEYMELMKIIDSEAFIAVNTGLGTVEEVAREIEYCNGSAETEMGKLRAENGHPEPYKVKWWAVGNEMYGEWQLGHMPLEEYVKKHNQVAEAILAVDPEALLIGVGAVGNWSTTMLTHCADHMNLLSEHIYCREGEELSGHIGQLADAIKHVADAHREYRKNIPGLAEKDIRIAMDEWNYWYGDYIYGELGVRYHQKDALGVARGLHEYFRNSDIFFMANYAQTVNVIGCIKTTTTSAGFATTGLPLKLYRNNFGTIPVQIENSLPDLDIAVALSEERDLITIAVVNSSANPQALSFDFENITPSTKGKQWTIHHPDPEVYNEPGKEPNVSILESDFRFRNRSMEVPGYAIVMVRLDVK